MRTLLDERQGITKVRGQWYEIDGRLYMPVFHPAYLLRNPSREAGKPKSLTWVDFQNIRAKFEELRHIQIQKGGVVAEDSNGKFANEGSGNEEEEWIEMDCPCSDFDS